MPAVQLADGELNYRFDGREEAPVLVLSNSLGTDLHMWDDQIPAFTEHFRVLRYDTRGHGGSSVTPGPYTIEQLGHDVLAMLDALKVQTAYFCGLSMGGLIGQWLAVNASDRIQRVVICNTAAKIGTAEGWNDRINTVLNGGQAAMVNLRDGSIARWFTPEYAQAEPAKVKRITDMLAITSPEGYAANCAAVRDGDFREQLKTVTVPVLVVAGTHDAVTTPDDGHFMQAQIPNAEYVEFDAAHLSNVQAGEAFSRRVLAFLTV
ncbi:3-oxoadipate enol-lactonase [Pseudomonas asuensis]|uniref:3-oxoadipate enol-lactonase n=1 Tax=Pseudomonas asuensis TaxID=1825787 RepID=A0ABQ2GN57_9PSED|nr:3-oxoadipate enol-lactonase [Pseudomonas asuensis]GGM03579.1 3-oxoadipate enol-lactonase [Pseudomonas asuensis]